MITITNLQIEYNVSMITTDDDSTAHDVALPFTRYYVFIQNLHNSSCGFKKVKCAFMIL